MTRLLRFCLFLALAVSLSGTVNGQVGSSQLKVTRIDIKHVGPPASSDEIIRANIRVKAGDNYLPAALDEDLRSLYGTGLFYNIRVTQDVDSDGGVALTYLVQGKPRLIDIQIKGNKKLSASRIRKKITSKVGQPLDERKLFTDSQAIQELYQSKGYPGTTVRAVPNVIEQTGSGTAVFEVTESPKIKITRVEFVGAHAFSEKELRKQIKTKKRLWYWSWVNNTGVFKEEQFKDDRERLKDFYRGNGYIDFEIKDVQFETPTPTTMIIRFIVDEGRQYRVGAITFVGTTLLPTNAISPDFKSGPAPGKRSPERAAWLEREALHKNFTMKQGDVFKMTDVTKAKKDLDSDMEAIENFYGARGHIDVVRGQNLYPKRIPNVETGTIDLEIHVEEGQSSTIEKIEIRGNVKTKDKVIRRELAVTPGETFNMVAVKLSKHRIDGLQYFEPDVQAQPQDTDVSGAKDLIISVREKNTGQLRFGAGFSTDDSVFAYGELVQGNFDLFNPPNFTGAGQKFRLYVQLGTKREDFSVNFTEPWFLNRKLALDVQLFHTELYNNSLNNLYDETRTGLQLGLRRALWSDFFVGSVFYRVEDVGIILDDSLHGEILGSPIPGAPPGIPGGSPSGDLPPNAPQALLTEDGHTFLTRIGGQIARDSRNSTFLPDAGYRVDLTGELVTTALGGERDFYRLEANGAWYFKGLAKGHVLEIVGKVGVVDGMRGDTVPFYERFYLGGATSLRGYEYRSVSPREAGFDEPIGGNTRWLASAEYSIPVFQQGSTSVRIAAFYDIGVVNARAYDFSMRDYNDNWGVGLRLNLPFGPLRLDYGIPITHDRFNKGSGRFQFSAGFSRPF